MGNEIDLDMILAVHRQGIGEPEGFIGFMRKSEDASGLENIGSFKASELKAYFPQLVEHLLKDSYFTVNSPFGFAPYKTKYGFQGVLRKEKHMRYLRSCYVDLDVGRPESKEKQKRKTASATIKRIIDLQDKGKIPNASIIARSGRGVYAFWLLHDIESDYRSQRAFPEKITLYKQINSGLQKKFKGYAPDKVKDASRVLRVPNSIHTGSGRQVTYWIQADQDGQGFVYSLKELAEFLDIPITNSAIPKEIRLVEDPYIRKIKNRGSAPERKKGFNELQAKRIRDYLRIEQFKGGFKKGYRRRILTVYTEFLSKVGYSKKDALQLVERSALNCVPSYPSDDTDHTVSKLINDVYSGTPHNYRNETLCKLFQVTKTEAIEFNLESIIPDDLRKERESERKLKPSKREQARLERLEAIKKIIEIHGIYTRCRTVTKMLSGMGIKTNRTTVNKDLTSLGIELRASGRPKKEST